MIQAEKLGMDSSWSAAFAGTKVVEIRGTVSPESENAANSTDSVWRISSDKSSNFPDSVWEIPEWPTPRFATGWVDRLVIFFAMVGF
jgi:hypothetical protein